MTAPSDSIYHISLPTPPSEVEGLLIMRNSEPFVMTFFFRLRLRKKNDDPAAIAAKHVPPIRNQGTAITLAPGIGVGVSVGVVGTCVSTSAGIGAIVSAGVDAGS